MIDWRLLHAFTVPGRPVGYYAQGSRPNWKRMKAYVAYKQYVQLCVERAGIDRSDMIASRAHPLMINTVAYFENGVHCDPENVRKGVTDALFYGQKGSKDKHTGGYFPPPMYDKENPRVEVEVLEMVDG